MSWVCIHDRTALTSETEALVCPDCHRRYVVADGFPVFGPDQPDPPLLDELWRLLESSPLDAATRRFCERHGCSRNPVALDWTYLFRTPPGGTVLEIGPGFGDDSVHLARGAGGLVLLVADLGNARILDRHLEHAEVHGRSIAVAPDLTRLPLADGAVDAIAMDAAAGPAFGLSGGNLSAVAAEWRRVLSPKGTLLLGLANPLYGLLGVKTLRSRVFRPGPDSLNRLVRRAGRAARGGLGLRSTTRRVQAAGFEAPRIYSPLPDERQPQLIVPADDAEVIRYFLDNLVRKNSPAVRAALVAARTMARLGLFRHFAPHHYLIFRRSPAPSP